MIKIQEEDFSVDQIMREIHRDSMGGIVSFVGVVRNVSDSRPVVKMEIEVYRDMAIQQLSQIREYAIENFKVEEVAIIHRYGELNVSDNIMMIAVGGKHRAETFEACRYIIEEIKEKVPIWKKEYTPSGESWVEGKKHGKS